MHAIHWQYREFRRFMPTAAVDVLIMLNMHVNARNRCWPSIARLAEEIGCSENTVTKGCDWLLEKGAIERVSYEQRVDQEKALSPNRHVYQLTGVLCIGKRKYTYWHLPPSIDDTSNSEELTTQNFNSSKFEAEGIDQNTIQGNDQTPRPNGRPSLGNPLASPFSTVLHIESPLNGRETVNGKLWEGVVYTLWQRDRNAEISDSTRRFAGKFVSQLMKDHPDITIKQAVAFNLWLSENKAGVYGKGLADRDKYCKYYDDWRASIPELAENEELVNGQVHVWIKGRRYLKGTEPA